MISLQLVLCVVQHGLGIINIRIQIEGGDAVGETEVIFPVR